MILGPLLALDTAVAQSLYAIRDMRIVEAFIWISELGVAETIVGLTGIVALVLAYRKMWPLVLGLFLSVFGTVAAVMLLKAVFERPRIGIDMAAYLETSFSFPSGHAALSLALYGFIVWMILTLMKKSRIRTSIIIVLIVLIIAIGFSRLYLGLHYISDVIGGYVVATVFLALGILTTKKLQKWRMSLPRLPA